MKLIKRILLAGASLAAMTVHAHADPISIGFFLFAGPLGGVFSFGTLVTAAQIGLYAVGAAAVAAANVIGARQNRVDPGQYKNVFETAESSEVNAGGRVGLGGLKIFGNTVGANRYRLVGHAKGPLVAIEEYRLGGREVTVEENGEVSSPPYATPGGSFVTIQTKIGDGTETAWSDLISAFPTLWTSAHRVRGIAQSLVKYISPGYSSAKFPKLYSQGEPPLTIVARMNTVHDPREEGADPDNPATWVWSMNGPLWAARIMSTYPDLTMASFDWDFIAEQADLADVLVATKTGTEPRSQFSGIWLSESKRGDTMQDVLDSVGCEIVMSDEGLIRIRLIDDVPTSEVAFTDAAPGGTLTSWTWQSGPEAVERPNVCRIKYYSPERNYEMADIDMTGIAWARIEDEIERYGEKPFDVELSFCPSASQAQRIGRQKFLLARADAGIANANWDGTSAFGHTYGSFTFTDLNETLLTKMAPPRIDDDRGTVEIPYVVWPQELIDTPWNPATMEADAPEQVPDIQYESTLDTPAAPSEAILVEYPNGDREVRVAFASVAGAAIAEAVYRGYTTGEPDAWSSMTEVGFTQAYIPAGTQKLLNHQITADASWTKGTNWTYGSGKYSHAAGAASNLSQAQSLTLGVSYRLIYTVTDHTSGTIVPQFTGGATLNGASSAANGTFDIVMTATANHTNFQFRAGTGAWNGSITEARLYQNANKFTVPGQRMDFRVRFFDADEEGSYFSDLLEVAALAFDNTAPSAPAVDDEDHENSGTVDGVSLTVTITELRVVKVLVEYNYDGGGWTTDTTFNTVRPGTLATVDVDGFINGTVSDKTLQWRVSAFTSNGTQGSYTSGSVSIPGNPL